VGKVQNHAAFAGFSSVVEKSALWTFPRSGFFHSSLTHKFCYRAEKPKRDFVAVAAKQSHLQGKPWEVEAM
jgi:hypothetical protein